MAFEKCPKCGKMHYRTDPCFIMVETATVTAAPGHSVSVVIPADSPFESVTVRDASGPRIVTKGRPRSSTPSEGKSKRAAEMRDYMRTYRAKPRVAKP